MYPKPQQMTVNARIVGPQDHPTEKSRKPTRFQIDDEENAARQRIKEALDAHVTTIAACTEDDEILSSNQISAISTQPDIRKEMPRWDIWINHDTDHPGYFVARLTLMGDNPRNTKYVALARTLQELTAMFDLGIFSEYAASNADHPGIITHYVLTDQILPGHAING